MKSTWKRIWKFLLSAIGWWVLGLVILVVVLYLYTLPWTGFGDYTTPTGDLVRGKTLWDWMQLLIIPLFLAAGAIAVNRSEKEIERQRAEERAKIELQRAEDRAKLEREIATDRQQEAALQSYLDRMAELLLKEKLRTTRNKEARNVARIRTLTVFRGLDSRRKGLVMQFLHEANLISNDETIVSLADSDLSHANLRGSFLKGINLKGVNLEGANLEFAFVEGANLEHANLNGASLLGANLNHANLKFAFVEGANLKGAKLEGANLHLAHLEGAIMPDGTVHD